MVSVRQIVQRSPGLLTIPSLLGNRFCISPLKRQPHMLTLLVYLALSVSTRTSMAQQNTDSTQDTPRKHCNVHLNTCDPYRQLHRTAMSTPSGLGSDGGTSP